MQANNKYPRDEKLKSKKDIDLLFNKGESIHAHPLRLIYMPKPTTSGSLINMGVSVPKRNIKLAVNRNLLKRRIREAYRISNYELKTHLYKTDLELNLMFIYTSKQILPYKDIEDKIKVILTRLIELSEVVGE